MARRRVAPPRQPTTSSVEPDEEESESDSSGSEQGDMSPSYSPSQGQEDAGKDMEAVEKQPPSAGAQSSPAPAQHESEEEEEAEGDSSSSDNESVGAHDKDAAPARHPGVEDRDSSDRNRQRKTNAPSAEQAKSPRPKSKQKKKAPARQQGEEDGDPSGRASQPKTNLPSAVLAKSPRPQRKQKKKAPVQQQGEREQPAADTSGSVSGSGNGKAAFDPEARPKRNALDSSAGRTGAPKKRMKMTSPEPKPKNARRTWSPHDEARILEALAEHRREHGHPPLRSNNAFFDSLAGRLEDPSWRRNEIKDKVSSLKRRYSNSKSAPTTDHEQLVYNLSGYVWGDTPVAAAGVGAENDGEAGQMGLDEMRRLYPHLAQELMVIAEAQPAVMRSFPRLDAGRAGVMEAKLERVGWAKVKMQVQVEAKTAKIRKELVSLLMELS